MNISNCSSGSNPSPVHGYNLRKRSIVNYSINSKRFKIDSSARTRPVIYKRKKNSSGRIDEDLQKYFKTGLTEIVLKSSKKKRFKEPKSNVHIHQLPNCILASIFKMLVPIDRVKVERVCQRWNFVARSFSWNNMSSLTIQSLAPEFSSNLPARTLLFGESRQKTLAGRVNAIVCRGGKYLEDVNLSHFTFLGYKVCNLLRHTPNVIHLNLSGILLTNSSLSTIGCNLPHLKDAYFKRCFYRTQVERGLSHFFSHCKSLELLDVSDNEHFSGERCFNDLPNTLLHLYISNNYRIGNNAVAGIYNNCPNLKTLVMDRIDLVFPENLNQLFDKLSKLEVLQYGDCFNSILQTVEVLSIGKLKNLKQLTLYDNAIVTEGVLKVISQNCLQLEKLDLSSTNRRIPDSGLRHLANLPQLSIVNFSGMRLLSDQTLKDIASNGQLKELLLHRCYKISDDSIVYVLKKCKQLCMLDVSYCANVTDVSLRQLLENLEALHCKKLPTRNTEKDKFCFWTKRSGITTPFPPHLKNPWLKIMNEMDYEFVLMGHLLHHVNNLSAFPILFNL